MKCKRKRGSRWLSCRTILWIMVFFGFAINHVLIVNMNISIVAMIVPREKPLLNIQCETSYFTNSSEKAGFTDFSNITSSVELRTEKFDNQNRYRWNEYEQGMVLGSFYWLFWTTPLLGGILARRYGTKLIFGLGNLIPSILGFFIPLATHQNLHALIGLRVMQGFIAGVCFPSMHSMTGKWIPPNERAKFVSSYTGSSFGTALTYPLCAFLIYHFGWESVFYVTSSLGLIWYGCWYFLVYDSPSQHPRISPEEKQFILQELTNSVTSHPSKVPWKDIFCSVPFWATFYTQFSVLWGLFTFITQSPTYFHFVHGWEINTTGILAGTPHLIKTIFAISFSTLCDWLLRTRKMSRTNVRKMATFIGTAVQGLFFAALAYSSCHPYLAVAFIWAGITVCGSIYSGVIAVLVDLSPNYASVLFGLGGVFVGIGGFISPAIVSGLTYNNQSIGQWRIVFLIAVFFCITSCFVFMCFGTANEQPWNKNLKTHETANETELDLLNSVTKMKTARNVIGNDENFDVSVKKLDILPN